MIMENSAIKMHVKTCFYHDHIHMPYSVEQCTLLDYEN